MHFRHIRISGIYTNVTELIYINGIQNEVFN